MLIMLFNLLLVKMSKFIRILTIASIALVLSACSREPTQEQLHQLYSEKVNSTNQLAEKLTRQKGTIIQIKNFEKIDCNKVSGSKDYLCRVNVTVNLPFLGDQKNTPELHVAKGENGWIILD